MYYIFFLFSFYILFTKIIVNLNSDVAGSFQSSSESYIVAVIVLIFIFGIVLRNPKSSLTFYNINLLKIALSYYIFALVTSAASLLPLLSAFRAISGIGFILCANGISRWLKNYSFEESINFFYRLLKLVVFVGIISNVIYGMLYIVDFNIFRLRAGYVGLIIVYLSLWKLIDFFETSKTKYFLHSLSLLIIAYFTYSFSAYIAFICGLIYLFWIRGYRILSISALSLVFLLVNAFILYLVSNPEVIIFGKPAGAFLIGSGRFQIYEASIDLFSKLEVIRQLIGVGFMAERELLSSYYLSWSSDPHNSFIVSLLGLGAVGAFLYILFILAPFFMRRKIKNLVGSIIYQKWITMHILFTAYGVTSSSYIAVPTMQFLLFMIFTLIIFNQKYKNA